MNQTGTIRKNGRITATPTKSDKSVLVDFGGHSEWFPIDTFNRSLIRVVKGQRITMEFVTTVGEIKHRD